MLTRGNDGPTLGRAETWKTLASIMGCITHLAPGAYRRATHRRICLHLQTLGEYAATDDDVAGGMQFEQKQFARP